MEKPKENLWNLVTSRKRPVKIIDMPIYDENKNPICKVGLRILNHQDHIRIQAKSIDETDRAMKEQKLALDRESKPYQDLYGNIATKHTLFEILRDPNNDEFPFFETPDQVGKLTNDEASVLMLQYKQFSEDAGPMLTSMSDKDLQEYINKLADSAEEGAYFLERMLPVVKNQLLVYMAIQLSNYQTGKFSGGLQQENSTNEEVNLTLAQQVSKKAPKKHL